jgi:hypothetical protein
MTDNPKEILGSERINGVKLGRAAEKQFSFGTGNPYAANGNGRIPRLNPSEDRISGTKSTEAPANLREFDLPRGRKEQEEPKAQRQRWAGRSQTDDPVKFRTDCFEIGPNKIEWGKTLNEIRSEITDRKDISEHRGAYPESKYRVSDILGFEANKARVHALHADRPVFNAEYDIAPMNGITEKKFYMAYIDHLRSILGEPFRTEIEYEITLEKLPRLAPLYRQGYGICKAVWRIDDVETTLRVFGEARNTDCGAHAADLQIRWLNEQKAAEPHLVQLRAFERSIGESVNKGIAADVIELTEDQAPFHRRYGKARWFQAVIGNDREYLDAQMVLTRPGLFNTPQAISDLLTENSVALCRISEGLIAANKWNAVCFDSGSFPIASYKITPDAGAYELYIGPMLITDSDDEGIKKLIGKIETETNAAVETAEYFDNGH